MKKRKGKGHDGHLVLYEKLTLTSRDVRGPLISRTHYLRAAITELGEAGRQEGAVSGGNTGLLSGAL